VAIFMVRRTLPALRPEDMAAVHRALAHSADRLSGGDELVRYLRSTYSPVPALCVCVFEAKSVEWVRRVNEVAQVPFDSIDHALDFENRAADRPTANSPEPTDSAALSARPPKRRSGRGT
jgi:hypothetical protein